MALVWDSLTEIIDRTMECSEQDQTARMFRLILLYTHRKRSLLPQKELKGGGGAGTFEGTMFYYWLSAFSPFLFPKSLFPQGY